MGRPCVQSHVQPLSLCGHRLHEVVLDWPYTQTPEAHSGPVLRSRIPGALVNSWLPGPTPFFSQFLLHLVRDSDRAWGRHT